MMLVMVELAVLMHVVFHVFHFFDHVFLRHWSRASAQYWSQYARFSTFAFFINHFKFFMLATKFIVVTEVVTFA
jgi:hypothetical protein